LADSLLHYVSCYVENWTEVSGHGYSAAANLTWWMHDGWFTCSKRF